MSISEARMVRDLMVEPMFITLAEEKDGCTDDALITELDDRAVLLLQKESPLDLQEATEFMQYFCALWMRIQDDGVEKHPAFKDFKSRLVLRNSYLDIAVLSIFNYGVEWKDFKHVKACAYAVVSCLLPFAPRPAPERLIKPRPEERQCLTA